MGGSSSSRLQTLVNVLHTMITNIATFQDCLHLLRPRFARHLAQLLALILPRVRLAFGRLSLNVFRVLPALDLFPCLFTVVHNVAHSGRFSIRLSLLDEDFH